MTLPEQAGRPDPRDVEREIWRLATESPHHSAMYMQHALLAYGGPSNPHRALSNAKWHPPRSRA